MTTIAEDLAELQVAVSYMMQQKSRLSDICTDVAQMADALGKRIVKEHPELAGTIQPTIDGMNSALAKMTGGLQ